jgi:hypothetical protein
LENRREASGAAAELEKRFFSLKNDFSGIRRGFSSSATDF